MWCWWMRNALFGWFLMSLVWVVATIVLDCVVLVREGARRTISWQTQQLAIDNVVVPAALGFLVVGLAVHFFKVRAWGWFDSRQPWWYWVAGGILGLVFVAMTWTQKGD